VTGLLCSIIAVLLILLWMSRRSLAEARAGAKDAAARQTALRQHEIAIIRNRADHSLNAMAEGVLILDTVGRVAFANVAVRELFGLGEEVTGRTLMEALRIHQLRAMLERAAAGERVVSDEIELPRLGSPARHFHVSCSRLDADDGSRAAVLVLHDITPLKQIEQTRADFVANVSHELRTPLSIIKGYAETLSGEGADAGEVRRFSAVIEKHADRLTALVEDLLTISGLESGRLSIERQRIQLAMLVSRVLDELAPKARARSVTLSSTVPDGAAIFADAGRIHQVLINLIENAINYGREGGTVTVTASSDERETVLSVSDNGPGIPVEARERVFERFYRLDKARSRERGGTGLGLSIVKHIALAHGGRVWVTEAPGGGACFCVAIPQANETRDGER
jgi:two-component system phosphate regulon sensor histidine kinase PhoR